MAIPSPAATLSMTDALSLDATEALSFNTTNAPFDTTNAQDDDVTGLFYAVQSGQRGAADRLLTVLYDELRRIARGHLRRERPEHTLNATSLVHEAYLRLVGHRHQNWQNRAHFFGAASRAMRRVLVDHARGRMALKRHGGVRVGLTGCDAADGSSPALDEVIAIDAALDRLAAIDERLVRIIDCRYFAGLTIEETATALGVSHTTVSDGWRFARAWLERALRTGAGGTGHAAQSAAGTSGAPGMHRTHGTHGANAEHRASDLELSRRRGWGSAA
jgi:RNA polymerase sigma-70 factor (ECF subfamily)